jgi:hypothetical protein
MGAFHGNLPHVAIDLLSCIIATSQRYCCVNVLLWECCCIATNTCRLVLLRVGPNRECSVFILLRWLIIDVRNMWEVSMEGSHTTFRKLDLSVLR